MTHDASDTFDTISLTSTVSSERKDQYDIDKVLAEREVDGSKELLVAWLGYPMQYHTWEPRENFNSEDTFDDWRDTQMRISRGLEKPFDIRKWTMEKAALHKETRLRRKRRNRKRRAAGWQVPDSSSASSSAEEEAFENDLGEDSIRILRQQTSPIEGAYLPWTDTETRTLEASLKQTRGPVTMEKILELYGAEGKENQILKDRKVSDLRAKILEMKMEFVDIGRKPPDYLDVDFADQSRQHEDDSPLAEMSAANKNEAAGKDSPSTPNQASEVNAQPKGYKGTASLVVRKVLTATKNARLGKVGSGPARQPVSKPKNAYADGRRTLADSDIAARWNAMPRIPKRKSGETPQPPKFYKSLSQQNNAFKRYNTERTPDVAQLVFVDPKTGKAPISNTVGQSTTPKVNQDISDGNEGDETTSFNAVNDKVNDIQQSESRQPSPEANAEQAVHIPPNCPKGPRRASAYDSWRPDYDQITSNRYQASSTDAPFSSSLIPQSPTDNLYNSLPKSIISAQRIETTTSAGSSSFSLMGNPTDQEKGAMLRIHQTNHVIGNMLIGHNHKDLGRVKFCGLARNEQRLLLGIKEPDLRLNFKFTKLCTAVEYNAYFHQPEEVSQFPGLRAFDQR